MPCCSRFELSVLPGVVACGSVPTMSEPLAEPEQEEQKDVEMQDAHDEKKNEAEPEKASRVLGF